MWRTSSVLLLLVVALLTLGMIMLASVSGVKAEALDSAQFYFVKRQAIWIGVGSLASFLAFCINYNFWRRFAVPLLVISALLLALLFVPGLAPRVSGSIRWFRFGKVSIQPSEMAKFALVVFVAWWMARERRRAGTFIMGFLAPLGVVAVVVGLILAEPDFGTTVLCGLVAVVLMFVGGARWFYLMPSLLLGGAFMAVLIFHDKVRAARIMSFLEPEKYASTHGYQLRGALDAFIAGGLYGKGFTKGVQKFYYLPESHTDFIFAVGGEELGLFWSLSVILLFTGLLVCGLIISWKTRDTFARLLASGITLLISFQAIINVAVVTGCMPTKGLPLPFMSYGGSSMVMTLLMVGILFNIACRGENASREAGCSFAKNRVRQL